MSKENKRFISKVIPDKAWRKLGCSLRQAWVFMWMNCDESGVYLIDEDKYEFETGGDEFPLENLKTKLSEYLIFDGEKILIKSFISVNYGNKLNPDYNPHKPLFRKIKENNLKLNSSLNQAYFKLVDEEEEEEEEEDIEDTFGKSENLLDTNDEFLNEVCDYFSQTREALKMRVHSFMSALIKQNKFSDFKEQTKAYIQYKKTSGEQSHRWTSYVTEWEENDWINALKNLNNLKVKTEKKAILNR